MTYQQTRTRSTPRLGSPLRGGALSALLALAAVTPATLLADETHQGGHRRGCSEATLRGAYGIQMQGTRPSGPPPAPLESLAGVVIRHYDGQGAFTQVDNIKGSVTGITENRPGSGTYEVSEDCTGATYFDPGSGIVIKERFVIVDKGREVRSVVVSPPPVMVTTVQKKVD